MHQLTDSPPSVAHLFRDYADRIYTLALRIVHDAPLAEVVVQQTFVKVIGGLGSFRGEGSIAGWLYRIGYREAIAVVRNRSEIPVDVTAIEDPSRDTAPAAEGIVLAGELARRLDEAIETLTYPLRAAFLLRDVEGFSTAEVAGILGVSESAVKMRLARAREALRVELKEYVS